MFPGVRIDGRIDPGSLDLRHINDERARQRWVHVRIRHIIGRQHSAPFERGPERCTQLRAIEDEARSGVVSAIVRPHAGMRPPALEWFLVSILLCRAVTREACELGFSLQSHVQAILHREEARWVEAPGC
jgi:hypothetical protein